MVSAEETSEVDSVLRVVVEAVLMLWECCPAVGVHNDLVVELNLGTSLALPGAGSFPTASVNEAIISGNSEMVKDKAVLGTSVTNLIEPPRALAASTVMWVRS